MRLPSYRCLSLAAVAGTLLLASGMGSVFADEDHGANGITPGIGPASDGPQRQTVTGFVMQLVQSLGEQLRLALPRGNKVFVRVLPPAPKPGTGGTWIIVDDGAPF